jgi:hypothetical protein
MRPPLAQHHWKPGWAVVGREWLTGVSGPPQHSPDYRGLSGCPWFYLLSCHAPHRCGACLAKYALLRSCVPLLRPDSVSCLAFGGFVSRLGWSVGQL